MKTNQTKQTKRTRIRTKQKENEELMTKGGF